jgi:hypothetical protein
VEKRILLRVKAKKGYNCGRLYLCRKDPMHPASYAFEYKEMYQDEGAKRKVKIDLDGQEPTQD